MQTRRLDDILAEHILSKTTIDFFSVDVEGLDLNVLKSNNWEKFRPTLVLAENLASQDSIEDALHGELNSFMCSIDYKLIAKTFNTLFFLQNNNGA